MKGPGLSSALQTIGAPHFFRISTDFDLGPQRDAHRIGQLGQLRVECGL
jgi:hypothetical protein